MSELPEGIEPAAPPAPRPSASAVLLRARHDGRWQVLLGLRSRQARFMPGHLAFPGGGVEPQDGAPREGFLARCASRELLEETGVVVAADALIDAGERITPPLYPVRFQTRFFVGALPASAQPSDLHPTSHENESLSLAGVDEVIEAWERGAARVPPPLLPILRTLRAAQGLDLSGAAAAVAAANLEEERAPRIEFHLDVWVLPVRTATLPPATHTNVWMPGGRRFVVIDPGCTATEEIARLLAVIERRSSSGSTPAAIALTHGHRDHVAGAAALARRLRVPLRADAAVLADLDLPADVSALPLRDGERLDLEGCSLVAVATPGHAPGHLAFVVEGRALVIAGDLVSGFSTILIDPRGGDMDAYLASLARVQELAPVVLLPGHGPPVAPAELARLIEHRKRREQEILNALREAPRRLEVLAGAVYADAPQLPARLAEQQTLAHLLALERRRVTRCDAGGLWSLTGNDSSVMQQAERRLRECFMPPHLEIRDESARHAGHPGAASGGAHLRVVIVAEAFSGRGRLERHRQVYAALGEMIGGSIHALALRAMAPDEWPSDR